MTYLQTLPEDSKLLHVFKKYKELMVPILEFHELLMRKESPFTVAERELIAAYVSGLNACHYCHGVHKATAERFGVDEALIQELMNDIGASTVENKMKPVLQYVNRLTQEPAKLTKQEAEAVYNAGWSEEALFEAVSICALFNFMNRLVEGLGITATDDYFQLASKRLTKHGYKGILDLLANGD